ANHNFRVTDDEIRLFIGLLLFTGYHRLPRERMYWSLDPDLAIPFVSSAISRNRFQEIKRYLHFADNSGIERNDKMYKVRPIMNILNNKFRQWGILHQNLSIDEAMVKYFGHHSAKQFIRGKPVRFGYKEWMLCSSSGYCYAFDVYCGAKCNSKPISRSLPLGSRVVLELLDVIEKPSDHIIFFDNYFTNYDLLDTEKEGFSCNRDNQG
ncbi:hypothetical protein PPYR_02120, partial [Photinus pyralis]